MGSQQEKVMYLTYTPATGETEEDTLANIEKVEQELMKHDDIDILQLSVTDSSSADVMTSMSTGGRNGALMYLIFDPEMEDFPEAKEEVENDLFNIGQSGEWKTQDFGAMAMSSDQVSYTLYSEDLDDLSEAVKQVESVLAEVDGLEDITSDHEDPYIEHTFKVDQQDVLQYGLTTAQIVMALSNQASTEILTTVESNGEDINVIVQREAKIEPKISRGFTCY